MGLCSNVVSNLQTDDCSSLSSETPEAILFVRKSPNLQGFVIEDNEEPPSDCKFEAKIFRRR